MDLNKSIKKLFLNHAIQPDLIFFFFGKVKHDHSEDHSDNSNLNPIGCKDKCWPDENIEKELHKMVVYANGADTKIVYNILACSFIYQTNVFTVFWYNYGQISQSM